MKNSTTESSDRLLEELKKAKKIINEAKKATNSEFLKDMKDILILSVDSKNNNFSSANMLLEEEKKARKIINEAKKPTTVEFLKGNLTLGVDSKNNNFLSNDIKLKELKLPSLKSNKK